MKNFKKILALLIAIIMVIPAIPVVASADTTAKDIVYKPLGVDDISADNPYVTDGTVDLETWVYAKKSGTTITLADKDDLIIFMLWGQDTATVDYGTELGADKVSATFRTYTLQLAQDITLNEGTATADGFDPAESQKITEGDDAGKYLVYTWTPWWSNKSNNSTFAGFRGTFDGQGHTIHGLVVIEDGSTKTHAGFLRYVGQGIQVKNLTFLNAYVKNTTGGSTGVIAGARIGNGTWTIQDVEMTDCVAHSTAANTGGIFGSTSKSVYLTNITMTGCSVIGVNYSGLFAGRCTNVHATITGADVSSSTVTTTGLYSGGLVGGTGAGNFTMTESAVDVTVDATKSQIGGLVGVVTSGTAEISDSTVRATVTSTEGSNDTDAGYYIAGLVGRMTTGSLTVTNTAVDANVTASRYVAGVVGTSQGDITMDGVAANVSINGAIGIAGLFGRPEADTTGTISISNSFVDGTVTATTGVAGGFIASTGTHTVTISNSVCAANVTVSGTAGTVVAASGGFIGIAESDTTMTNCQFLGFSVSNQGAWEAGFATVGDVTTAPYPAQDPTAPASHYTVTLTDCYYLYGSGTRALCTYYKTSGDTAVNNWYNVTIGYTGEEAVTTDLAALFTSGQTGQGATGSVLSESVKVYYRDTSDSENADVIGAQMGTNGTSARIVATVAGDQGYDEVEFSSLSLNKYMTSVVGSGNRPWQSYSPAVETACDFAYKSLKSNYGLETVTAGENEYLIALGLTGISAETATTVLVRPICYIEGVKTYCNYMGVIFYNGNILGCFYMN